ncbi:MAG: TlpA family protein disulfide reductase [Chloroflexi bacterium]|nr:TlpA family protein disulfide reductase [Chloroflexota bacterium]
MRLAVLFGVVAGLVAAALLIVLLVSLAPAGSTPTPTPGDAAALPTADIGVDTGAAPSTTAGAATTPTPTAPPAAPTGSSPSASASGSGPLATASPSSSPPQVGLAVGDRAPTLQVERLDGAGEIGLTQFAGTPLWINFMATYCPSCQDELPLMESIQEQLGDELVILVVDVREDRELVASYMDALGIELAVGLDPDGRVQQTWGTYALPVHYWIDGSGFVRGYLFGSAGPDQFLEGVRTVVPDASFRP